MELNNAAAKEKSPTRSRLEGDSTDLKSNNSISFLNMNNQEQKKKNISKCIKLGHKNIPEFIRQGGLYGQ